MEVEISGDDDPTTELIREGLRARYSEGQELFDRSPSPRSGSVATTTLTSDEEYLQSYTMKQEEQSVTDLQSDVIILQEVAYQSADPSKDTSFGNTKRHGYNDGGQH